MACFSSVDELRIFPHAATGLASAGKGLGEGTARDGGDTGRGVPRTGGRQAGAARQSERR